MPAPAQAPEPAPASLIAAGVSWLGVCARTLRAVLADPGSLFDRVPDPVPHGFILRFLATLRLPPWLLLALAEVTHLTHGAPMVQPLLPIHGLVPAPLARALSVWLLLMVPVGLFTLYFLAGLLAHLGLVLTGGSSRSIGATMRAVGLNMAPGLLVVGSLELPLWLGWIDGAPYLGVLAAAALATWVLVTRGLVRTHHVGALRGAVIGLLPVVLLAAVSLGRAALVMHEVPGLGSPSESLYYIP